VWSESDGLPGLIVDRYGSNVVFQTLTLAMDLRRDLIIAALRSILQPATIIERNDAPIRKAEGLESRVEVVAGSAPGPFWQKIGGIDFELDLLRGQKTGFYLDQVDSYAGVAAHAQGRSVLDCFANQGAFALCCAKAGAAHVQAVEISADACAQIRRNAEHNQLKVAVAEQNVFDFLKLADAGALNTGDSARYDLIVLDPPSFTKSKGKIDDAMRGYKEIHLRALKLLTNEGLLATFCCSHHVTRSTFLETINAAAVDARRTLRQIRTFSQGLDHPIITTLPETEYLQGFLFELAPGR
jgi:23S rRNA (cytosine1962-C5)-methyltransferase